MGNSLVASASIAIRGNWATTAESTVNTSRIGCMGCVIASCLFIGTMERHYVTSVQIVKRIGSAVKITFK